MKTFEESYLEENGMTVDEAFKKGVLSLGAMNKFYKLGIEAGQRSVLESAYNEGRASRDDEVKKLDNMCKQLLLDIETDACGKCWCNENTVKQTAFRVLQKIEDMRYELPEFIINAIKEEFKLG